MRIHLENGFVWSPTSKSPAHPALDFCRLWLSGQQQFILHTSGSTGQPKPIAVSRAQMEASAWGTIEALGLRRGYRALVCISTAYIGGTMMLVRAMELGMDVYLQAPSSNPFLALPHPASFDFAAIVPLQLQQMLGMPEAVSWLNQAKAIIVGGAPVGEALEQQAKALIAAPMYSTFGMTETVSHIALRRMGHERLFQVLPRIDIGTDARGCLWVEGAVTKHERIFTNDVVRLAGSNAFEWLGRADNTINSGGVKIQAEAVEQCALQFLKMHTENLPEIAVFPLPHETLGQQVVMAIESAPLPASLLQAMQEHIKHALGPYHAPKAVHFFPVFPRTATGKVVRAKLVEMVGGGV